MSWQRLSFLHRFVGCIVLLLAALSASAVAQTCRSAASYELHSTPSTPAYTVANGVAVASAFAVSPATGADGLGVALWLSLQQATASSSQQQPATARVVLLQIASGTSEPDTITLSWDVLQARLMLHVTLATTGTDVLVLDNAAIPINTNTRRLVGFNVKPTTGEILLTVDGELVGSSVNNSWLAASGFPLGGAANTLASVSLGAAANGSSVFVGSVSDLLVTKHAHGFTQSDLHYLLAFQYPQVALPNGTCASQCLAGDAWCPPNASAYFFTRNSFSFPAAGIRGGSRFVFPIRISPFALAARLVNATAALANQSWTVPSAAALTCGVHQTASVALAKGSIGVEVDITVTWAVPPEPSDVLQVQTLGSLGQMRTLAAVNGSALIAAQTGNASALIAIVAFASGPSVTFTLLSDAAPSSTSFGGGSFCITRVSLRERPPLVLFPASSLGGIGNNQSLQILTGLRPNHDALAVSNTATPALSCDTLSPSLVLWPVSTNSLPNGAASAWSVMAVPLPALPVDVYTVCVVPGGAVAQAYPAARCTAADPRSPFLCRYTVAYLPTAAQPLGNDWVTHLLHLGATASAGIEHGLFAVDYFAAVGGEANIQPQAGNTLNSLAWTEMQAASGLWGPAAQAPLSAVEAVHYFAVAIYASQARTVFMSFRFANALAVWVDGSAVLGMNLGLGNISGAATRVFTSGPLALSQGWHQVMAKLWVAPSAAGLLAMRVEQPEFLAWAYASPAAAGGGGTANANFTVVCAADASSSSAAPCIAGNPALSHDECVALGCCFQANASASASSSAATSTCSLPDAAGIAPYRTDGRCGVAFPSLVGNVSQCDASNVGGDPCCGSTGVCGSGFAACDCPTCANYQYSSVPRSRFVPWGQKARCLNALELSLGFGLFSTCATACNLNDQCTAFSLSSLSASGGTCVLYISDCSQTLADARVAGLFARDRRNCGFPQQQQGVMCTAVRSTTLVGNATLAECLALCNVTTLCAGVQYRPHASAKCAFLAQSNCSVLPLTPSSPSDVYAVFRCDGDAVVPPVPLATAPNQTQVSGVGCFSDPTATFLAQPASFYPAGINITSPQFLADYTVLPAATVDACQAYCQTLGAPLFALSNGSVCTCGVRYNATASVSPSQCQLSPCPSNTTQFCGGPSAALLFRIGYTQQTCPAGSLYFNQNCYAYFGATPLNFSSARQACAAVSGFSLASIHSMPETQYVLGLLSAHNRSHTALWTGGQLSPNGGALSWADGSPADYSDWRQGQPSLQPNASTGLVLGMSSGTLVDGSWSNAPLATMLPYACKMPAGAAVRYAPAVLQAATSDGARACVTAIRAVALQQQLEALYAMNYGTQFTGDEIPDNSPNRRPLRAVYNGTVMANTLQFVSGVMQTSLNFTGRFALRAEAVWGFASTATVFSASVWLAPSAALFLLAPDEVFVAGRLAQGTYTAAAPAVASGRYAWALLLYPRDGRLCFVLGMQQVCAAGCNGSAWVHAVAVFDGAALALYLNGTLVARQGLIASVNVTALLQNATQRFAVGYPSSTAAQQPFVPSLLYQGLMDDLRLYSQSLDGPLVRYLFTCTPYHAPSNVLAVYQGSAGVRVVLDGADFNAGQLAVVAALPCLAGDTASAALPSTVDVSAGGVWSVALQATDLYVPPAPLFGQAQYLHLCFLNSADRMFIAGSSSVYLGVAVVTGFAGSIVTASVANFSAALLPRTVPLAGVNLADGQVLVASLDPACATVAAGAAMALRNSSAQGAVSSVTIPNADAPRTAQTLALCWGASSTASTFHPTGFFVTGIPLSLVPGPVPSNTPAPAANPPSSAAVPLWAIAAGGGGGVCLVVAAVIWWCRKQRHAASMFSTLDTPMNAVAAIDDA